MTLFLKIPEVKTKKSFLENFSTMRASQSKVNHNMKSLYISSYSNDKVETVSNVEYICPIKNQDGSNQRVIIL